MAIITCPWTLPTKCNCTKWTSHARGGHLIISYSIYCDRALTTKDHFPDFSSLKGMPIWTLSLRYNNIREIPDDAFKGLHFLGRFESMAAAVFDLSFNNISTISEHAFRGIIANNIAVHMTNCTLTAVPYQLKHMINLTDLKLTENYITDIPAGTFHGFNRLKRIYLSGMSPGYLDDGIFSGLEETLEGVYISKSSITQFPSNILRKLKKLKIISLKENRISYLHAGIFRGFESAARSGSLNLRANSIEEIHANAFYEPDVNMSISNLNLVDNKLTNVRFLYHGCDSLIEKQGPKVIHLTNNPIKCDCEFYDFALAGFVSMFGECTSPPKYINTHFEVYAAYNHVDNVSELHGLLEGSCGEKLIEDCTLFDRKDWDTTCLLNTNSISMTNDGRVSTIVSPMFVMTLSCMSRSLRVPWQI